MRVLAVLGDRYVPSFVQVHTTPLPASSLVSLVLVMAAGPVTSLFCFALKILASHNNLDFNCGFRLFSPRTTMTAYRLPSHCLSAASIITPLKDHRVARHHAAQKEIPVQAIQVETAQNRSKCQSSMVPHHHCKGTGRDLLQSRRAASSDGPSASPPTSALRPIT